MNVVRARSSLHRFLSSCFCRILAALRVLLPLRLARMHNARALTSRAKAGDDAAAICIWCQECACSGAAWGNVGPPFAVGMFVLTQLEPYLQRKLKVGLLDMFCLN
jgi:hypothetical protein